MSRRPQVNDVGGCSTRSPQRSTWYRGVDSIPWDAMRGVYCDSAIWRDVAVSARLPESMHDASVKLRCRLPVLKSAPPDATRYDHIYLLQHMRFERCTLYVVTRHDDYSVFFWFFFNSRHGSIFPILLLPSPCTSRGLYLTLFSSDVMVHMARPGEIDHENA